MVEIPTHWPETCYHLCKNITTRTLAAPVWSLPFRKFTTCTRHKLCCYIEWRFKRAIHSWPAFIFILCIVSKHQATGMGPSLIKTPVRALHDLAFVDIRYVAITIAENLMIKNDTIAVQSLKWFTSMILQIRCSSYWNSSQIWKREYAGYWFFVNFLPAHNSIGRPFVNSLWILSLTWELSMFTSCHWKSRHYVSRE